MSPFDVDCPLCRATRQNSCKTITGGYRLEAHMKRWHLAGIRFPSTKDRVDERQRMEQIILDKLASFYEKVDI